MSRLRKSLYLNRSGIKKLSRFQELSPGDETGLQEWLDKLVVILEENHKIVRDAIIGSTAAETPNWFIREANAADVTAGRAKAAGNLIVIHKTNGTKREFGA